MSSVGPLGGVNVSAAGAPLAQTKGSDVERASQDVGAQHRNAVYERKAEAAAGIGETDGEDHQTAERDANGRRILERVARRRSPQPTGDEPADSRGSKDVTGQSGNQLDLSG